MTPTVLYTFSTCADTLITILTLMTLHFFADFLAQTSRMALGKSKSWYWLSVHVATYGLFFLPFGWKFWLVTMALHFVTDAITSRINARLYQIPDKHWFFCGIGVDQLIHLYCLAGTAYFLSSR